MSWSETSLMVQKEGADGREDARYTLTIPDQGKFHYRGFPMTIGSACPRTGPVSPGTQAPGCCGATAKEYHGRQCSGYPWQNLPRWRYCPAFRPPMIRDRAEGQ